MEVPLQVDRICRTCLGGVDDLTSIFDDDAHQHYQIALMVAECSNMKIRKNDGFPDKICSKCIASARNAYAFKQQCGIAFRTLRSLAEQYNLTIATVDHPNEDTKETQTDPETSLDEGCLRCRTLEDIPARQSMEAQYGQQQQTGDKEKEEMIVEVEYLQEADGTIASDKSNESELLDQSLCKVEVFENVEYLAETFDDVAKQIKDEPVVQYGSDTDAFQEQLEANDVDDTQGHTSKQKPRTAAKGSPGNHRCEYCDKLFSRSTHLRRHMMTHTQEKPFKCKHCPKTFARNDHMTIHETTFHSKERPYSCEFCDKTFKRSEHLRSHVESKHTGTVPAKKPEICKICNKGFSSQKNLALHQQIHLKPKVFSCACCGEQFPDKKSQRAHEKEAHQEGKTFLCTECGQSFLRNDYLMVHMRRHKGIKPYKCKFCPKAFPRATDLRVHEKYHTNEKPHLCTICGKGFHRSYNLQVHSRTHNGLKPYQCPHCPKTFTQSNDLKAHVRRHTGERYRCELCCEGFIQGYQLTNHKRTVHNIDTDGAKARRVTKFLSSTAQEQQVLMQEHQNRLEQLISYQQELEQQQRQLDTEEVKKEHDPELEKKIAETKEQIQVEEREIEAINSRLHEELARQQSDMQQTRDSALAGHLHSLLEEQTRANFAFGQQFLNDPSILPAPSGGNSTH